MSTSPVLLFASTEESTYGQEKSMLGHYKFVPCMMWFSFIILMLGQPMLGQKSKPKAALDFSEGVNLGVQQMKILDNDLREAVFSLETSWIPGEGHKGYIRYKIHVYGKDVALSYAPYFIGKLHACSYTLNLYDRGQFIIRRIPLIFSRAVADSGDVTAMDANDMTQMDLSDYKSLLPDGNWKISWYCDANK